jgi:hypothetical protein
MESLLESLMINETQSALWAGAAVMIVLPGLALVWVARRLRGVRIAAAGAGTALGQRMHSIERIDERLNSLCTAMSLLTDSTESGLRDAIAEIERLSRSQHMAPARQRAAVQRRVKGAARRGRSARDIAVAEGVSEGEVRLRLGLLTNTPVEAVAGAQMR